MVVALDPIDLYCRPCGAGDDVMSAQQLESRIRSFVPLVCVLIGIGLILLFSKDSENRVLGAFLVGLGLGDGL